MKVFTYSEARQKLSTVLDLARSEEVVIKRRGGEGGLGDVVDKVYKL